MRLHEWCERLLREGAHWGVVLWRAERIKDSTVHGHVCVYMCVVCTCVRACV